MKAFILGVVVTLGAIALVGYVGITQGILIPANADARPGNLERWAARASLHATLAREAGNAANPVRLSDANLTAGLKIYMANCAACHGVADGKPSTIAFGLYQKTPQLGKDGVEDDPGAIVYWKVAHGIRLTGMPAFTNSLDTTQIWEVALFLRHMDSLPAAPKKLWEAAKNPVAIVPESRLPKDEGK